jgi:anti-anti-sigma factor
VTSQTDLPAGDLAEVPYFSLDLHRQSGVDAVELLLTGDVDDATVGHLEDSLDWVVEHMPQQLVVVDLTGVTSLGPCGVASLRRVATALRNAGRSVSVRGGSAEMNTALAAAGVLRAEDVGDPAAPPA